MEEQYEELITPKERRDFKTYISFVFIIHFLITIIFLTFCITDSVRPPEVNSGNHTNPHYVPVDNKYQNYPVYFGYYLMFESAISEWLLRSHSLISIQGKRVKVIELTTSTVSSLFFLIGFLIGQEPVILGGLITIGLLCRYGTFFYIYLTDDNNNDEEASRYIEMAAYICKTLLYICFFLVFQYETWFGQQTILGYTSFAITFLVYSIQYNIYRLKMYTAVLQKNRTETIVVLASILTKYILSTAIVLSAFEICATDCNNDSKSTYFRVELPLSIVCAIAIGVEIFVHARRYVREGFPLIEGTKVNRRLQNTQELANLAQDEEP